MLIITFDEIKDATVIEYAGIIRIDIDNTRLELEKKDAEYLLEQLEYHFMGETYGDLKYQTDEKIMELQEEIRTLRRENEALRLSETVYERVV